MQQSVRQALRNLHLIHPQRPNFFESKSSYQKGWQILIATWWLETAQFTTQVVRNNTIYWKNLISCTIEFSFANSLISFSFWWFPSLIILLFWFQRQNHKRICFLSTGYYLWPRVSVENLTWLYLLPQFSARLLADLSSNEFTSE